MGHSCHRFTPAEEAHFWRIQLINAAKAANFFANILEGGAWWVRLRLVVLGQELRYVVATQKVGHGETGVLAITVFAELVPPRQDDAERGLPIPLFTPTSADSVTLTEGESLDQRWADVCHLIERTLAASVKELSRLLS